MGLLDRAIAIHNANLLGINADESVRTFIADYHRKNPSFHCIVFNGVAQIIADMTAAHGAECTGLEIGNCLLLLPGALDRELFAHRISHSTGSEALCQTSASSASLAIQTLSPYLR